MASAIEGGTVILPILKHVSEMATQFSIEPSGSSERSRAAAIISMVAGEAVDWLVEGVSVPRAGVCKMGTGAASEGGVRSLLSLSSFLDRPLLFFGRLTKRWMMYSF